MQNKYRKTVKRKQTEQIQKKNGTAIVIIAVLALTVIILSVILIIQGIKPDEKPPISSITPPACSNNETYTVGKFTYKLLDDGSAMITDCSLDRTVTELFIPDNMDGIKVTAIGDSAFELMTWLTSVNIPEGVTYIGQSSFAFCAITSVNLPSTVSAIQNNAFKSCDYIKLANYNGTSEEWKKVTVGSGNTSLSRQITFLKNS